MCIAFEGSGMICVGGFVLVKLQGRNFIVSGWKENIMYHMDVLYRRLVIGKIG